VVTDGETLGSADDASREPTFGPQWDEGVLQALYDAAFSQPGAEVVGVLVGQTSRTSVPPRIAAMIPASTARSPEPAQLDHEAWSYIHATMARYYAGFEIVGWWMSRPGPGTALGQAELDAAGQSFAHPDQFGFVFDSQHRRAALYGWRDGGYVRLQEGVLPRRLTRPVPKQAGPLRAVFTAVGMGATIGLAGWLAAGKPGLSIASLSVN
jgi:hypothetical protein